MDTPVAIVLTVSAAGPYSDHEVRLSGHLVGYRKFDGSASHEVASEVLGGLADLLRERFGYGLHPSDGTDR